MKAIILNSGTGSRMGDFTENNHKSMVEIKDNLSLINYQLTMLKKYGINKILITTGHLEDKLKDYILSNHKDLNIEFVYNPKYSTTNYIYSMYLALDKINEDTILMHGDLYFDESVFIDIINASKSSVVVDTSLPLPEKDFKAEVIGGRVSKIATYINNENSLACQPLYKLKLEDWNKWKMEIKSFCEEGKTNVYAEEALNNILDKIWLNSLDIKGRTCMEVDTLDDLKVLKSKLNKEN